MPISDPQIQLALVLRQRQFESETSLKCNLAIMNEAFLEYWKSDRPSNLASAIDFIFSITNQQLIETFVKLQRQPDLVTNYSFV